MHSPSSLPGMQLNSGTQVSTPPALNHSDLCPLYFLGHDYLPLPCIPFPQRETSCFGGLISKESPLLLLEGPSSWSERLGSGWRGVSPGKWWSDRHGGFSCFAQEELWAVRVSVLARKRNEALDPHQHHQHLSQSMTQRNSRRETEAE